MTEVFSFLMFFFFIISFPSQKAACSRRTLLAMHYRELLIHGQGSGKNDVTQQCANHLTTAGKNVFNTTKPAHCLRATTGWVGLLCFQLEVVPEKNSIMS